MASGLVLIGREPCLGSYCDEACCVYVYLLHCSPNGEFVMAGSSDGTVYIWNVAKNRVEKALREHKLVLGILVEYLFIIHWIIVLCLCCELWRNFFFSSHAVMACSWNPNGQSLLTCDKQKQVVYWADFWINQIKLYVDQMMRSYYVVSHYNPPNHVIILFLVHNHHGVVLLIY